MLMKQIVVFLLVGFFIASPLHAEGLEDLWSRYAPEGAQKADLPAPGVIYGEPQGKGTASFSYQWKFRPQTYEMHFQHPQDLSRRVYALALTAGDISPFLPREKFYKGVTGFHYSAAQLADWLNQTQANHLTLTKEENELAGELIKEGIIVFGKDGYVPGDNIKHVLGAAPGARRTFNQNLLHERLHVFWDENSSMRENAKNAWAKLTEAEKSAILQRLRNYNPKNEAQLIEEWAILDAEQSDFNIK